MGDDSDTVVCINRSPYAEVYHTERGCIYLPDDDAQVRETTADAVGVHYDACRHCTDPSFMGANGGGESAAWRALERARAEDVPPGGRGA